MKSTNKKIVAVVAALALAVAAMALAVAAMAGCASQRTDAALDTPGILTAPVVDAVHAAGEQAEADREAAFAAEQAARASENARALAAAMDEAALAEGEIVEDENAPEGTVAVKNDDGTTRYVPSDTANSHKGSNNGGSNGSNGGSSSSNSSASSNNSGSNSGSGNSSNNSAPAPAPAPEPKPAPAPAPDPKPDYDDTDYDNIAMNEGSTSKGECLDCGWHTDTAGGLGKCPACGSWNYMTGF